jgi:hypothetical protein
MKTEHITDFRSKHDVLVEPLTEKELKENARKDGTIQVKVLHDFDHILTDSKEGIESDVAVAVTRDPEGLTDMNIELVGRKNFKAILKVTARPVF